MENKEPIFLCIVAKQDLKIWNGKEYIRPEICDEIDLPKSIARLEARHGFVRLIGPR